MRAAQLVQPRTWKLIEVDKPEVSNGNMLVRLERVAICGTDRPSFWGGYPSYPLEPGDTGHEGMGIVEACPVRALRRGGAGAAFPISTAACFRSTSSPGMKGWCGCRPRAGWKSS